MAEDLVLARKVCTGLLGPSAVADEKTDWGRRLDIIGFTVDLDSRRVTIPKKNFLNTLYGFLYINLDLPIPLRTAQRLASWGEQVRVHMSSDASVQYSPSQDVRGPYGENVNLSCERRC